MLNKFRNLQSNGAKERLMTCLVITLVVSIFSMLGGVIYVAWHFVSKYW